MKILQVDFPYTGPYGEEMAAQIYVTPVTESGHL